MDYATLAAAEPFARAVAALAQFRVVAAGGPSHGDAVTEEARAAEALVRYAVRRAECSSVAS